MKRILIENDDAQSEKIENEVANHSTRSKY